MEPAGNRTQKFQISSLHIGDFPDDDENIINTPTHHNAMRSRLMSRQDLPETTRRRGTVNVNLPREMVNQKDSFNKFQGAKFKVSSITE